MAGSAGNKAELLAAVTPDALRTYLNQIARVPLLTAAQEVDLAMRIEASLWAEAMLRTPEPPELDRVMELTRRSHLELEPSPPTPPEVPELCRRLVLDRRLARSKLVEANLRLVVSIAKRSVGRGVLLLDLIQEGNWASCGRWRSSSTAEATSSAPTPPGGSARR